LILYSGLFLSETLFIVLMLIGLIIYSYVDFEVSKDQIIYKVLLGIIFGLGALVKSQFILFGPIIMGWRIIVGKGKRRLIFKGFVIVGISIFITILPWTIRNYLTHGEFVLITTNGGEVFWQGNNSGATGGDISHLPEFVDHPIVKMDPVKSNKIGYRLAFEWIRENPLDFCRLCLKKLNMYWSFIRDYQYDDLWGVYIGKAGSNIIPTINNAVIIFLSIFGFVYTFSIRSKSFCLHLLVMLFSLIHMLFLSGVRYRVGIFPIVIIFAAEGINFFRSIYKKNKIENFRSREVITLCVGITLFFLLCLSSVYDVYYRIGAKNLQNFYDFLGRVVFN
jgi:4-amino-4-deoxy-L-arabinose transferase-like glycosyltransferase